MHPHPRTFRPNILVASAAFDNDKLFYQCRVSFDLLGVLAVFLSSMQAERNGTDSAVAELASSCKLMFAELSVGSFSSPNDD